jgi:hypothetical protein
MDWVYGVRSTGLWLFIKCGPLIHRWRHTDHPGWTVFVDSNLECSSRFWWSAVILLQLDDVLRNRASGCHGWPLNGSNSTYGGRKRARFLPTWPMRWGVTVLLTYRGGDGGGGLAMTMQLLQPWVSWVAHPAAPLAHRTPPVASLRPTLTLSCSNCFKWRWIYLTRKILLTARVWDLRKQIRSIQAGIYRGSLLKT